MRKLYQILYNVGRLTDAPGGGRFLSRGDTLAWAGFPFWGTLWRGQACEGGKALGVTKPRLFPPSRSPFPGTSLFCAVVWGSVLANACMLLYWWHQAEPTFFFAGRKAVCAADLFLVVVVLLALIYSCLLFYCWR
mgnify:CR=1 FL=1